MPRSFWRLMAGGCVLLGLSGCGPGAPRVGTDRPAGTPQREVEVHTGAGGADVEVDGPQRAGGRKVGVDVNPGGGVDVDVNGPAIRADIQERRAERARKRNNAKTGQTDVFRACPSR